MVDVRVYKYQEKSRLLHYIPFFLHLLVRLPLILNMRTELGDWKYLYYSEQRTDVILFFHGVIGTKSRYIFLNKRHKDGVTYTVLPAYVCTYEYTTVECRLMD